MNHARTTGASVYEQTKVTSISFSDTDPNKPISVTWTHTPPSSPLSPPASPAISSQAPPCQSITGSTAFTYLIDATGRAGIMSTKYLKNRNFTQSLKNIAVWGYWKDVGSYGVGTPRQGAPWFEALTSMILYISYHPSYLVSRPRRIGLGMVHPSPQCNNIYRRRHEPADLQRQHQVAGPCFAFLT